MINLQADLYANQQNDILGDIKILVRGEAMGRSLTMKLYNEDGSPLNLSNASMVSLFFVKGDGTNGQIICDIIDKTNGIVNVTFTSNSAAAAGDYHDCIVKVTWSDSSNSKIIGPKITVRNSASDEAPISSNEFQILDELITAQTDATETAVQAAKDASASAKSADTSASDAATSASTAQTAANTATMAKTDAESAKTAAQTASKNAADSASSASADATRADSAATQAVAASTNVDQIVADAAAAVRGDIKIGGRNLALGSDLIYTMAAGDTVPQITVFETTLTDADVDQPLMISVHSKTIGDYVELGSGSSFSGRWGVHSQEYWRNSDGTNSYTYQNTDLLYLKGKNGRYEAPYKIVRKKGATLIQANITMQLYCAPAVGNDEMWELGRVKLERGNKATDWSPAPEDVDKSITDAVDGIQVGGRNLLRGSADFSDSFFANDASGSSAKGTGTRQEDGSLLVVNKNSNFREYYRADIDVAVGMSYTVSVRYKHVSGDQTFQFQISLRKEDGTTIQHLSGTDALRYEPLPDGWTLVSRTFEIADADAKKMRVWFRSGEDTKLYTSSYYIKWPKIETGQKVTDWSPAIEDVEKNISDAIKGIQIGGRNLLLGTSVPAQKGTTDAYAATTVNQRYNYSPIIANDLKAFLLSVKDGYLLFSYDVDVPAIYKDSNQALNRVGAYFSFKITNKTTDAATTWYGTHSTQGAETKKHHYVSHNSMLHVSAQSADSPDSFVGHYSCYLKMSEVPALKAFYANPDDYKVTGPGAFAEITGMTKGGCIKNLQLTTGQYEMDWTPALEDVDPAERLADMDAYIGYTDGDIYGVEVDFANRKFTRLAGAVGRSAGAGFDSIHCFGGRRRCNVANNGAVTAYYGEAGFTTSGKLSNGTTAVQVMVEQPKFYYKVVPLDVAIISEGKNKGYHMRKARYYVSDEPKAGFKLHPAFIENGKTNDFIYLAAFEGSLWDSSASTYILDDAQVADFEADMLSSIANAKPASGRTQSLTRPNTRKLAQKRGEGWEQAYVATISASQLLMLIEYASFDMQKAIGNGVTNKTDDGKTSMAEITGATVDLGNASGSVTNANGCNIVSYRGEENLWGNIWTWVDGMNEENPAPFTTGDRGTLYVADHGFDDDSKASPYRNTGIHPDYGSGYVSAFGYSEEYDWLFIPSEHTGNSSLPVGDYFWNSNPGWRVGRLGSLWNSGDAAGAFCWNLHLASSDRDRIIGGRLVYVPTKADMSEEPEDPAPDALKLGGVEAKNYVQKSDLTTKRCAYIDDATLADGWYYTDDNTTGTFPTGYSKIGVLCVRRSGFAGYTQHYMSQEGEEASRGYSGASWGKWSNGVGTWTPVLRTNTGAAVEATYTTQEGWFSRSGQLVHVGFRLAFKADLSTYSNAVYIGDLPYKARMDEWGGTCAIGAIDSSFGITQYILRSAQGGALLMIGRREIDAIRYENFADRSMADITRYINGAISYIIAAGK